ncbi:adenylate/guanylate cyclase domain-containing protein [uncultured Ruegeria sp.]|uniref:adenylate/guanylate cyclase domain-containing protein n=1 Tax=uncultured Ruegeria sp. TaxID=259304 RepID=UPI00262F7362|nr:adenylate/guanylate cyclase domain-containing protein [uncultured Ruegeria sp.]
MILDAIRIGHDPDDDDATRRLKSVLTIIILVAMMMSLSFFLFEPDRSTLLRGFDVAALVTEVLALVVLRVTRSAKTLFYFFCPLLMAIQFGFTLLNGNREGDILPFIVIPAAAVVVLGPDRSRIWFAVSLGVMLFLPIIEMALPEWTLAAHQSALNPSGLLFDSPYRRPVEIGEGLAMAIGVFFIYFLTYSGYKQLQNANALISFQKQQIEHEHDRAERLLENILPHSIADRLKRQPDQVIADDLPQVTVLFADIVGFTPRASQMSAAETVSFLNSVFSRFDKLADKFGLEKIKTVGDAYMVAGGLPEPRSDHASSVADMALEMIETLKDFSAEIGDEVSVRIGIHTGPAVAGVIGTRKFFYDVWGDTVNLASRLESHGLPGKIQVSNETREALGDACIFETRGPIEIK